jgi:multidrug efflux system outer membrane protein
MPLSGQAIKCPSRPAGLIAGLSLLTLAGCAQLSPTPPHAQAAPLMPVQWSQPLPPVTAPAVAQSQWWQRFNDPVLDELMIAAQQQAADVRTAQARLRQARAGSDLATAALWPSLGVSASAARSHAGGAESSGQSSYAAGFDARWEPSIFGGPRDTAQAAEQDLAAAAASLSAVRISLAAEVALQYVTLRSQQQRLAIARENLASQAATLQLVDWRHQAGLVSQLTLDQARAAVEQTRAQLPALETARAAAVHRLAVLTGQLPANLLNRLQAAQALPAAPEGVAIGIPHDTLRQRPDIVAAEASVQAERARLSAEQAARWPSLNLSGSFGWRALAAGDLGASDALLRTATAGLAATLFDGGRISARIESQQAALDRAHIAWQQSVLAAVEEVENALAGHAAAVERLQARQQGAVAARSADQLARTLFEAGSIDFQQVLDTQRSRLAAEDGLASAATDRLMALIKLYKALGGGWSNTLPAAHAAKEAS